MKLVSFASDNLNEQFSRVMVFCYLTHSIYPVTCESLLLKFQVSTTRSSLQLFVQPVSTCRPAMDKTLTAQDHGITLNSFGQQILPIYTQICLCFSIDDPQAYSRVITTLESALDRLFVQIPWLAGRVANEGATASSTGVFRIKSIGSCPRLVFKDLRDDSSFPSMKLFDWQSPRSTHWTSTSSRHGKHE